MLHPVLFMMVHLRGLALLVVFVKFGGSPFILQSTVNFFRSLFVSSLQTSSSILFGSLARFPFKSCIFISASQYGCFRTTCSSLSLLLVSCVGHITAERLHACVCKCTSVFAVEWDTPPEELLSDVHPNTSHRADRCLVKRHSVGESCKPSLSPDDQFRHHRWTSFSMTQQNCMFSCLALHWSGFHSAW